MKVVQLPRIEGCIFCTGKTGKRLKDGKVMPLESFLNIYYIWMKLLSHGKIMYDYQLCTGFPNNCF